MATVLVDSTSVRTDAQSQPVITELKHTNATLSFENPSSGPAVYRITDGNKAVSPESTVEGLATTTLDAVGLDQGVNYDFTLQRLEFGSWVNQGNPVAGTTIKIDDIGISTSSKTAMITWPKTHDASYAALLFSGENGANFNKLVHTINVVPLNSSTNRFEAVFTELSNTIDYRVRIQTIERNESGNNIYFNQWQINGFAEFTPSDLANLNIDEVFSSYAELSWDDGNVGEDEEDGEAEFNLFRKLRNETDGWVQIMPWTPDTTKTFTDTGLIPGVEYQYRLQRRGLDGKTYIQDEKFPITKKSEVRAVWAGPTVMVFQTTPPYDDAPQKWRLTPSGKGGSFTSNSPTRNEVVRNLSPNTSYLFEHMVVENGEDVVVGSFTASTTPYSILTLGEARHTGFTLNIQNFSDISATNYRIANEDASTIWATKTLAAGETASVDIYGFQPGSTHKLFLQRAEQGVWNNQKFGDGLLDHLAVTAKSVSLVTSVATTSALFQWDKAYDGASYEISIYDEAPDAETVPIQIKTNNELAISGDQLSAVFTGLVEETPYWGTITVLESNTSGVSEKILVKPFNFDTSAGAAFQVSDVKASSVSFVWDAGEVLEEDGVAEFKVRVREDGTNTWNDATAWLPHTTNSFATVSGLKAGTKYKFALLRLRLDGGSATQAIIDVETKTSALTVSGSASSKISVEWTEIYPNAQYQLVFTAEGESPVTFGGGPITETSATLTGLESNTNYLIELYVLENGVAVGISTSLLGSAATVKTGMSPVIVGGAVVVSAVVVGIVVYKMKFTAAAKALR